MILLYTQGSRFATAEDTPRVYGIGVRKFLTIWVDFLENSLGKGKEEGFEGKSRVDVGGG